MKITICGSSAFVNDMKIASDFLVKNGFECFLPEPLISEADYAKNYSREKLLEMKPIFTERHFKKIEKSDAILVINNPRKGFDGYLGSNTLMEVAVALYLGKKIFMLNQIPDNHPHYEELIGLNMTILNGDLSNIN